MIPMGRPKLPPVEALLPYLKRIDQSRWYTNAGPLVHEYEQRLGKLFNCHVAAVSSATAGMTSCLLAQELNGRRINVQSWTFVATANAIRMAGHIPSFQDVDPVTWRIKDYNERGVRGVLVSPFGAPVLTDNPDPQPFFIDAAGGFDAYASGSVKAGDTPVVISTHATKVFATGEGGMVLSTDEKFIHWIKEIVNHGLTLGRAVPIAGINGKMSEYHAAVGLASLDLWAATRWHWLETKRRYLNIFGDLSHTTPLNSLSWVGSVFCVRLIERNIDPVIEYLKNRGITSRRVWGEGCHRYEAYEHYPHNYLPVTEKLVDEVLFVPFSIDMTDEQIYYISGSVKDALKATEEKVPNMWGV